MGVIILQDEIVHYEVLGRGKPLVFLHGWVGSWRYWIPATQAASANYRAYAFDLWGFGDSAKNPMFYTVEQQTNLLGQFLQEMGIGKIALVGHGLGALVALQFTQRFPRIVDRALLIGHPVNGNGALNPRLRSSSISNLSEWLLGRTPLAEPARSEASKTDPQAVQISLAQFQSLDLLSMHQQLTNPCLMVYGQNDPIIEAPPVEQLLGLPENIHQVVFEQSAHFPMLDDANKFNRLMADFLTLTSGISPRQLQLKEEWRRRVR